MQGHARIDGLGVLNQSITNWLLESQKKARSLTLQIYNDIKNVLF